MDAQIIKSDGTSFLLSDHDIFIDDFIVSSISIESTYQNIEGRHGKVDYGATHGDRSIRTPFHLKGKDLLDYPLVRDTLFDLVTGIESFFIRELRRPKLLEYEFVDFGESAVDENGKRIFKDSSQNVYVGGKRYLVRSSSQFDVEQLLHSPDGQGELTFETTELPYAESIGTSQDIQDNGIDSNSELWGFGMGLIAEDESLIYTHESNVFRIYNAGNVAVHPFQQDLKITISNVIGSTSFLELKNITNGSTFRVNEAVTDAQTIILDGPNVTSNGLAYLRKTNRKFIELAPGWNDFVITGVYSAKVEVDTRFYYR